MDRTDPFALRSPALVWFLGHSMRWYFHRRFHAVRIARDGMPAIPAGRPLIIYSNHPSWWDPALFVLLGNRLFPGRPGFGPMEAAALSRYPLLRRIGIFGIEKQGLRGAARFLSITLKALADPRTILWVTAEGGFTDPRQRPVRLRPGIAHLARTVPQAVLLPLALEYTFWNENRPEALLRFGEALPAAPDQGVAAWTELLAGSLTATMDRLAEDAMTRDAGRFHTLVHGRSGVGGAYDTLRQVRALTAGRRFAPSPDSAE
ncbi:MAG TPA: lysophospholipid acyltransferase family protein [Acetobacteraceae bacterium]|nr:lysophospholipid acyltransferase family protein [Acetobacteraceae bacterium]